MMLGHNEYWPSSLTKTRYMPLSSSKGLAMLLTPPLDKFFELGIKYPPDPSGRFTRQEQILMPALDRMSFDLSRDMPRPGFRPPRRIDLGIGRGKEQKISVVWPWDKRVHERDALLNVLDDRVERIFAAAA